MASFWASSLSELNSVVVEIPDKHVLTVTNVTRAIMDPSYGALSFGLETQQLDGSLWKGFVCHFDDGVHQHKLDLILTKKVKFYVANGCGRINLTGYFQAAPPATLNNVKKTTTFEEAKVSVNEVKKKVHQPKKSSNIPELPVKQVTQPATANIQALKGTVQTPKAKGQTPKLNGPTPNASVKPHVALKPTKTAEKSANTPQEQPKTLSKAARKRARKEEAAKAALATKEVTWDQDTNSENGAEKISNGDSVKPDVSPSTSTTPKKQKQEAVQSDSASKQSKKKKRRGNAEATNSVE